MIQTTRAESLAASAAAEAVSNRSSVALALQQATALAAAGRFREAIAYATEANRAARDPQLEHRLVDWRHKAFIPPDSAPADWPPVVDDRFAGVTGAPEIAGDALTDETLAAGLLHHGCLLVRNLISPADAAQLADGITHVFEAMNAYARPDRLSQTASWYAPFKLGTGDDVKLRKQRITVQRNRAAVWLADAPRLMFEWIDLYERRGVIDVIQKYLRERPVLSVQKGTLRLMPPTAIPEWHQDGAFLGNDVRAVNVWLALSDCGVDAPGLDILPRRLSSIVTTGTHGARSNWSVGPGMVEIVAEGTPVASPIFRPGDAVLFDQRLLHTTGVRPGMTKPRYAIESWFFASSARPERHDELVV